VNSDRQSWINLTKLAAPFSSSQLQFETWASDPDIYTLTPHWPTPAEANTKKLRGSLLHLATGGHATPTRAIRATTPTSPGTEISA
jgi:hypothetical protein